MTHVVAEMLFSQRHPRAMRGCGTRKPLKMFHMKWLTAPKTVATAAVGARYAKNCPIKVYSAMDSAPVPLTSPSCR